MTTSILEIDDNEFTVSLMDGSIWRLIDIGEDISKIVLWYPAQRINVEKDSKGKFILTNLDTAGPDKIRVSRVIKKKSL